MLVGGYSKKSRGGFRKEGNQSITSNCLSAQKIKEETKRSNHYLGVQVIQISPECLPPRPRGLSARTPWHSNDE